MKCNICQLDKPETKFYQRKAERQGEYLSACKLCRSQKKKTKVYADIETSRENSRKIMREFRNKYPEKYRKSAKQWRQKNVVKGNAMSVVKRAVKSGRLSKPKLCEFCFQPKPLQGHHEDYSKPLDVKWLCIGCHKSWHRWKILFDINSKKFIKYPEKIGYNKNTGVCSECGHFLNAYERGHDFAIDDMQALNKEDVCK